MPLKAGTGRGKKLAGKFRQKKRKVEETEDEGVHEAGTDSPRKERREMNPTKCLEKSQSGSLSPQQSQSPPPVRVLFCPGCIQAAHATRWINDGLEVHSRSRVAFLTQSGSFL